MMWGGQGGAAADGAWRVAWRLIVVGYGHVGCFLMVGMMLVKALTALSRNSAGVRSIIPVPSCALPLRCTARHTIGLDLAACNHIPGACAKAKATRFASFKLVVTASGGTTLTTGVAHGGRRCSVAVYGLPYALAP